eukprot:TRINITY_DN2283_c0_g1_i3.p1 TRINITY_DN2283_c0_g1~~TRINITY_DN2283_c0_g1_i3.p1  ORF type:complete len:112 (-),score=22.45 TRINITY_DN2283_c0_g1_i3:16-306(-)
MAQSSNPGSIFSIPAVTRWIAANMETPEQREQEFSSHLRNLDARARALRVTMTQPMFAEGHLSTNLQLAVPRRHEGNTHAALLRSFEQDKARAEAK